jgi:molybdopterin/thiamine biosynthesis adenylyltransferase
MSDTTSLTHDELQRYGRQMVVAGWGEAGQLRLKNACVAVVGAGGLGSASLSYLATAGVGHISIIDDDRVELSNLNRQILHETGDVGCAKVQSAAERIAELNPHVTVTQHRTRLDERNASTLLKGHDAVIDAVDNFATRYAINAACHGLHIPWVYCAVRGFEGQLSCFKSYLPDAPCYQCFVPYAPHHGNDCRERGAIGAVVGVMGSLAAMEALKILLDAGQVAYGTLLRYDAANVRFSSSQLMKDVECQHCGGGN